MRKNFRWLAAILLLLGCQAWAQDSIGTIEKNFRNTPENQKLGVYWYWVAGNMSKDGVVKDLQAMKEVGINRAFIGMIGEEQGVPQGPVRLFTDEWWDILHTMFKTAGELGIEIGMFNSPGWSQSGGPWVEPEISWLCKGHSDRSCKVQRQTASGRRGCTACQGAGIPSQDCFRGIRSLRGR